VDILQVAGQPVNDLTYYNNIVIIVSVWRIDYYQTAGGKAPVADFIDSLDVKSKAKVAKTIDLLEQFGVSLGMPYAKHIEGQLWELRTHYNRNRYRIIYFLVTGQTFILLHGFIKKSGPIAEGDLQIARTRHEDYLARRRKDL